MLVIHSYHQGLAWTDSISKGLLGRLEAGSDLTFIYLDTKRIPAEGRRESMLQNIAESIRLYRPRIVIAIDDFAYELVSSSRDSLLADIPLVFGGVNFLRPGSVPRLTAGVVEAIDIAGTLELAASMNPRLRRVVVVNDDSPTGRANAELLRQVRPVDRRVELLVTGSCPFVETEDLLASLDPAHDAVLLLTWNQDSEGRLRSYETAIERAHAVSNVPIYGVWSFYLGRGIVGGHLLDGELHGREVGGMAGALLNGVPCERLGVVSRCQTRFVVDLRELAPRGLSSAHVPASAELLFPEPSLWNDHRRSVVLVGFVLLLLGVGFAWLAWNMSRRKRAERALMESQERLRLILDSIGDAVLVVDTKGLLLRGNPVAEQLLGRPITSLVGRSFTESVPLYSGDNGNTRVDPVSDILLHGVVPGLLRARIGTKPGAERLLSILASPLRDTSGLISGVVIVLRDITARIRYEDQLRQMQKTEALGLLAGGLAHDFNNIIQAIEGNLELVRDPVSSREEVSLSMDEIANATVRAAGLTRQLLAYGRRQNLNKSCLDLSVLVEGILVMIRRLIGPDIRIEFSAPREKFWVLADAGQVEQIVLNLCLNGRDAMPRGGILILGLSLVQFVEQDRQMASWIRPGSYVVLTVADNGVGMDSATLSRVFEPFFTTKQSGRGTGLGLAVVQGIVEQHEGLINVYSEPKVGTSFNVYLPRTSESLGNQVSDTTKSRVPICAQQGVTVLVADDDPSTRASLVAILRRYGYQVLECVDGEDACSVASSHRGTIAVALLDVVMPRLGGLDAGARIQASRPEISIVISSGHPEALSGSDALKSGWHFLAKPYPSTELLQLMQKILGQRNVSGVNTESGA